MAPIQDQAGAPPVVLVPGHWLGGWAWSEVEARLAELGHEVECVSLPGTTAGDPPAGLADQVDSLAGIIERQGTPPLLVAHSGAGRVATGVLDRAPASVVRVVYVDSGPAGDDSAFAAEGDAQPAEGVGEPAPSDVGALPSWEDLEAGGASLEGLDASALDRFRAGAVPVPLGVLTERLHLTNDARRDVPTTIIANSIPSEVMMGLAQDGHPMFAEVARLTDLTLVDLPTGHWPMWSRPTELADAIAAEAAR